MPSLEDCKLHLRICHLLLCSALVLSCFDGNGASPAPPGGRPATGGYPEKGVVHWKSFHGWDRATIFEASRASMMITPISWCFSPKSRQVVEELRRCNPDIKIIGYKHVLCVIEFYPDTAYAQAVLPYDLEYYDAVSDDWAYTNEGDTLMIWPETIFLNPIMNGQLNRALITEQVDLVEKYQSITGDAIDGIMHDYFMHRPYISLLVKDRVVGEVDFDGDGTVMSEDEDEQALFILWQKEYAREIRSRFGDDFIQIGNGRLPQDDPEMAHILNGIFYEEFPPNPWRFTDREGFQRLLEYQADGYLSKARGRTWSILTNVNGGYNNDFCLIASLIAGCFYTELYGSYVFSGWSLPTNAGRPTGEIMLEGDADSLLTYRRTFKHGEALLSFHATGRRWDVEFIPNEDHGR
jgi:hypothetical protein